MVWRPDAVVFACTVWPHIIERPLSLLGSTEIVTGRPWAEQARVKWNITSAEAVLLPFWTPCNFASSA